MSTRLRFLVEYGELYLFLPSPMLNANQQTNHLLWPMCHLSTEFCENQLSSFCVILQTNKQTNCKHTLHGRGNKQHCCHKYQCWAVHYGCACVNRYAITTNLSSRVHHFYPAWNEPEKNTEEYFDVSCCICVYTSDVKSEDIVIK